MKQPKDIGKLIKKLHVIPGDEVHQRTMRDMLDAHGKVKRLNEGSGQQTIFRMIVAGRMTKWATVAVIAVGMLAVFNQFGDRGSMTTVVWADVVQRFNTIAFFNASVYMKDSATDEPMQIEIWRNSQKKARIRVDKQVLFADGGEVVAGYSTEGSDRKIELEEYDVTGMRLAQMLFGFQEFSLDAVVCAFGVDKQQMKETTPLINPRAMISEDLLVFDVESKSHPQWLRIWVLRESRLPVRIRLWDPRDGECVDVVMSYSAEQTAEFFDPKAFEVVLKENKQGIGKGGRANLAYALLNDPGGRSYTPRELFEKEKQQGKGDDSTDVSGYHMPEIEQAGVTEYGAVWIVTSKSTNYRPDGRPYYGAWDVIDDLNRKYKNAYSMHRVGGDIGVHIIVPEDYPFDTARAKEMTLRCRVDATRSDEKNLSIGDVKLDAWQEKALWPRELLKKDELGVMLFYTWSKSREDHEAGRQIIDFVRQHDTNNQYSHESGKIELRMLIREKNYEQASLLAEKLLPGEFEVFQKLKANAEYRDFYDYIIVHAANGDLLGAAGLFERVKHLEPNIGSYSQGAQKHIRESLARQVNGEEMFGLLYGLFSVGLNPEQVSAIVGFDVMKHEDTKWYVPDKYRRVKTPREIKQEAYREKLSVYYKANPLEPGQMVFKQCKLQDLGYLGPIPGVKDHYFYVFHKHLHDFLKYYKSRGQAGRVNRIRFADGIENPMLQHEIIIRSPDGFEWDEIREFIMMQFNLEAVESQATETVLIAEYDGRPRKDYRDVRCPVEGGLGSAVGSMSMMSGQGISLRSTLDYLASQQGLLIINNTGIDGSEIVTQQTANFKTEEGMKFAEQWYEENFGITFRREQRQLPVWTIRKIEQ